MTSPPINFSPSYTHTAHEEHAHRAAVFRHFQRDDEGAEEAQASIHGLSEPGPGPGLELELELVSTLGLEPGGSSLPELWEEEEEEGRAESTADAAKGRAMLRLSSLPAGRSLKAKPKPPPPPPKAKPSPKSPLRLPTRRPSPSPSAPPPSPRPPFFIGGCAGTRYGCCPDGVTPRSADGSCALIGPPPGALRVAPEPEAR